MKRVITKKQLETIVEAVENAKGTPGYNKYFMCIEHKNNGKWSYVGWYLPYANEDCQIKKVKDEYYIMQNNNTRRVLLTPAVIELLNLEL